MCSWVISTVTLYSKECCDGRCSEFGFIIGLLTVPTQAQEPFPEGYGLTCSDAAGGRLRRPDRLEGRSGNGHRPARGHRGDTSNLAKSTW